MKRLPLVLVSMLIILAVGCVTSPHLQRGDEFYAGQDYVQALRYYELALTEVRDGGARRDLEAKIKATRDHLVGMSLAKADALVRAAQPDKLGAVKQAIAELEQARSWDNEQRQVEQKIAQYRRDIDALEAEKAELRDLALQQVVAFEFPKAFETTQRAVAIDAGDEELRDIAGRIVRLQELNNVVINAVNNNQIDQAMASFEEMRQTSPIALAFANYPLRTSIVEQVRRRLTQMELENRWYGAFLMLNSLHLDEFAVDLQRVRSAGAQYYYQRSSVVILDSGDFHHAYLLALLASKLDENDIRIFRRLQETQDQVSRSIQSYIAVSTFDPPSNDPDAGRQFSDSLISYLYSVLPYGINILERDRIDFVLQEQRSDNFTAGQLLGVDLMVTGGVSLFRVDTNIDKRTATANIKVGEEMGPNPEYQQMVNTYGTNTQVWPHVPPMMISRDRMQMMSYTRGTAETRGFAKVSVRIFDTDKGAISFVKDFDANLGFETEFQDEVKEAGIEYKPMRLPSETEVKEQMRREIVAQVAEVVQASFEAREHRFLNQAQFFMDRREPQMAIRPIAQGYYYCIRDGIPEDNPAFVQIQRLLPELAESYFSVSPKFSLETAN